jgi:hypothetical protein
LTKVKYVGPYDEVEVPSLGLRVKNGETVEVEDASGLVGQEIWEEVKASSKERDGK